MFQTSNPVLRSGAFEKAEVTGEPVSEGVMTVDGTVRKTALLLLLVALSGVWVWGQFLHHGPAAAMPWVVGGAIGGLVVSLVGIFRPRSCVWVAPAYALLEGLVLGGVSAIMDAAFHGVAVQAVVLTAGVLLSMLAAWHTGLIRVTERFKLMLGAATGGVMVLYLGLWVASWFGVHPAWVNGSGLLSIGLSMVVAGIAALNLVLDFETIREGALRGAPRFMEWYGAFALLVTLVWLYLELLRLLAKLRSRD